MRPTIDWDGLDAQVSAAFAGGGRSGNEARFPLGMLMLIRRSHRWRNHGRAPGYFRAKNMRSQGMVIVSFPKCPAARIVW